MYIDAHAHYDDEAFDEDRANVLAGVHEAGCDVIINAAQDIPTAVTTLQMADAFPYLFAAVGIHPHKAQGILPKDIEEIRKLAQHEKCVAIGEIGLDYHYDFAPRQVQQEVFRQQLRLAGELQMPVVIHDREAHEDTLKILDQELSPASGCLIHCYSGSREMAEVIMKRGYYVSIGGAVTFKNARRIVEALEVIPTDRILLETDCPYMTPVPHRGERNDSSMIPFTAQKICEIKGVLLDCFYKITSENAISFYHLKEKAQTSWK